MDDLEREKNAVEIIDRALDSQDLRFVDKVKEHLEEDASEAARVLGNMLYSSSDQVKLAAARDILDRSGYKPVERKEVNVSQLKVQTTITDEKLMQVINGFIQRYPNITGGENYPSQRNLPEGS